MDLGKWIAQLVLPDEIVRREWKRFRQAFVYVVAQVISAAHRWFASLVDVHQKLQV